MAYHLGRKLLAAAGLSLMWSAAGSGVADQDEYGSMEVMTSTVYVDLNEAMSRCASANDVCGMGPIPTQGPWGGEGSGGGGSGGSGGSGECPDGSCAGDVPSGGCSDGSCSDGGTTVNSGESWTCPDGHCNEGAAPAGGSGASQGGSSGGAPACSLCSLQEVQPCAECEVVSYCCELDSHCPDYHSCSPCGICETGKGDTCTTCSDCQAGHMCNSKGHCQVIPGPGCEADQDCDEDQACVAGVCQAKTGPECKTNGNCKAGNICNNQGLCQVIAAGCTTNEDCDFHQICNSKSICQNTKPPYCTTNADCGTSEVCNTQRICQPITGTECVEDSDCKTGDKCVNDICLKPAPPGGSKECTKNADCTSGDFCDSQGTCQGITPIGCKANTDCPAGGTCDIMGNCQSLTGPPSKECSTNSDCTIHQICNSSSKCQEAKQPTCTVNIDCGTSEICNSQGVCQQITGDTCAKDSECKTGTKCVNGICLKPGLPGGAKECRENSDCNGNDTCDFQGRCQGVTPVGCKTNTDCEGGICDIDGSCQTTAPPGKECSVNADCDLHKICNSSSKCQSTKQPTCTVNNDCGTSEICNTQGVCQQITGDKCDDVSEPSQPSGPSAVVRLLKRVQAGEAEVACKPGTVCVNNICLKPELPGGAKECRKNSDCNGNDTCDFQGRCQGVTPVGCKTNTDCQNGGICDVEGHCQAPPSGCKANTDCADGQICDFQGKCQTLPPTSGCSKNEDCGTSEVCNSQRACQAVTSPECTKDSECESGKKCVNEVCLETSPPRGSNGCKSSSDCEANQVCDFQGVCQGVNPVGCKTNEDCNGGEICDITGQCQGPPGRQPPSRECSVNSDCKDGQICSNDKCGPCSTNPQCGSGQVCNMGSCEPIECNTTSDCNGGQICLSDHTCGPCSKNKDCGAGNVCSSGLCEPAECNVTSDCIGGQVCLANKCGPCSKNTECPSGQQCSSDGLCEAVECTVNSDCESGQICDASNKCGPCTTNPQCGSGQVCNMGSCEPIECNTTSDCNGGQVCKDSKCGPCSRNSDCGAGNVCTSGLCEPTECNVQSDCNGGQVCKDNKCGPCTRNIDCSSDQQCSSDGICEAVECTVNSDCESGQICDAGNKCGPCTKNPQCGAGNTCNLGSCEPIECNTTSDCNGGQVCKDSKCTACERNTDCGTGNVCSSGLCEPAECNISSDCNGGQVCKDHKCGPCSKNTDCPSGQQCDKGTCSRESPTFTCDEGGYLIQGTILYRLDLATGENSVVNENVASTAVGSLGFNIKDNFLYAGRTIGDGQFQLIRIDASGTSTDLDLKMPTSNSGDIDDEGQYWTSNAGNDWAQVDLNPESSKFGKIVGQGDIPNPVRIADWVFLENGGRYLYSITVGPSATAVRWSMDTKRFEQLKDYGTVTSGSRVAFGALYAVGDELWGSDNDTGDIFAFPVLDDSKKARKITDGPSSTSNDGARCFKAPPPSECEVNSDCKGGQICTNNQCGNCSADDDCADDLVCNKDTGACEDPECRVDSDCDPGLVCNNNFCTCPIGLDWQSYNLKRSDDDKTTTPGTIPYTTLNSEWFDNNFIIQTSLQGQSPNQKGTTDNIGLPFPCDTSKSPPYTPNSGDLYGQNAGPDVSYSIYMHEGYLHPRSAGPYTIKGTNLDEAVYIWTGDKAKGNPPFTSANTDFKMASWTADKTYTINVSEDQVGTYIPLRIAFINTATCGRWTIDISGPNGTVLSKTEKNGEIVRGCAAKSDESPPFPVPPVTPPAPKCDAGLQWAFYVQQRTTNEKGEPGKLPDYPQRSINLNTVFSGSGHTPKVTGTTTRVSFPAKAANPTIYGKDLGVANTDNTSMQLIGYVNATTSGDYTITATRCDDHCWIWTGDKAKTGWNVGNADLDKAAVDGSGTFSVKASKGDYIPIRIILVNQKPSAIELSFAMASPGGEDAEEQFVSSCENVPEARPFSF